jgi:hypothetical protein
VHRQVAAMPRRAVSICAVACRGARHGGARAGGRALEIRWRPALRWRGGATQLKARAA